MSKSIYDLKLHEELEVVGSTVIKRVLGGWIYYFEYHPTGVFVPFDNEFQVEERGQGNVPATP